MQQYKLVKEFGEGVDRMFREMEQAGNPAPEYKQIEFMVKVRLNSNVTEQCSQTSSQRGSQTSSQRGSQRSSQRDSRTTSGRILNLLKQNPLITRERISVEIGISDRMVAKYLKDFQEKGVLERVGGKFGGQWVINDVENNTFVGNSPSGPEGRVETDLKNSNTNLKTDLKITKTDLKTDIIIYESIKSNPSITISELQNIAQLSRSGVKYVLEKLKDQNLIRRIGPDKGGHWEVK